MPKIIPVILAGGSGTRLWPVSRKSYPKQFTNLMGEQSLFQSAALRLSGVEFAKPIIITGSDFRFIVTEQLLEVGIDPGAVLIEPEGKNTAPAILAAVLHAAQDDEDAVFLVVPSDHVIPDTAGFTAAAQRGLKAVAEQRIVTFGIVPDRAETGYGYLELDSGTDSKAETTPLRSFVEKPDLPRAEAMLAAGNYLWNAGIFLFAGKDILKAFEAHAGEIVVPVQESVTKAQADLGFLRLDPDAWSKVPSVSVDYAVMEKATEIAAVPVDAGWSDLGSWTAIFDVSDADADGGSE